MHPVESFEGRDVTIEVTPRRVTIIRDDRLTDIEISSITALDLAYPTKSFRGRFRIVYQGAPIATANIKWLDAYSIVEFSKDQEKDFRRLRDLIHQYQDASS